MRDIICFFAIMICLSGCSDLYIYSTKEINNSDEVLILSYQLWEYNQPCFYKIVRKGTAIVPQTFIEARRGPSNVRVETIDNLVFGFDKDLKGYVLFIHRLTDDLSWPYQGEAGDELLNDLRLKTNDSSLELITRKHG